MARSIWSPKLDAAFELAQATAQPGARKTAALAAAAPAASPPFPSPADWRDVWIYMLMTDRFNNPDRPPRTPWDHKQRDHFQGGTFEGVRRQLDYLRDLGVGAIWLTPVLKNCPYFDDTYHGYGIQDFVEIDARLASDPERARADPSLAERELRALVDDAHAHGIYVIFDIVLNHTGDVFVYGEGQDPCAHSAAPFSEQPYPAIHWRAENGCGRPDWTSIPQAAGLSEDAVVWPEEFQSNDFFRRQGQSAGVIGDFEVLKQMRTDLQAFTPADGSHYPVRNALIRTYQYLIARFDVDGYRIDTLKYVQPDFALTFGNAMREYALSLGKKNFFTFGEVYDSEDKIAAFIGRNTAVGSDMLGVDAALDFPLFFTLPGVAKGQAAPSALAGVYEYRRQVERDVITSHGEAGAFFVTFLDNHDQGHRFYYQDAADPQRYDAQATLGLACLFALQGIPCLYYGTEQGLHGTVDADGSDGGVREALWGKNWPHAFERSHPFYETIQRLGRLRAGQPALRYGRQYFRPISGDSRHFGVSEFAQGVIAFSRILSDQEVLVVANTNTQAGWQGEAIVDFALNPAGTPYEILFSNCGDAGAAPGAVAERGGEGLLIREANGSTSSGPARVVPVRLAPMEVQFLARDRSASTRVG